MSPRSNGSYTVLLVDDDPSVLSCTRRCLERAGYRVLTASDPVQVLATAGGFDGVDLILLDYRMPGMTGLELLEGLRRSGIEAKCILLSAFLNDEVRTQAAGLKVDRVLDKPVEVDQLRGALAELLPSSGAHRPAMGADATVR
jgi:two-component system response regulator (stage 0 sporulation protein F)